MKEELRKRIGETVLRYRRYSSWRRMSGRRRRDEEYELKIKR